MELMAAKGDVGNVSVDGRVNVVLLRRTAMDDSDLRDIHPPNPSPQYWTVVKSCSEMALEDQPYRNGFAWLP